MVQIWCDASTDYQNNTSGLGIVIIKLSENGTEEIRIKKQIKESDNNIAELKAIELALSYAHDDARVNIITDSQTAIDAILGNTKTRGRIKEISDRIKGKLSNYDYKLYHRKAHSNRKDKYSQNQNITDKLAKESRQYR